ncbi:MAG TPA: hypothetical protein VJX67_11515, partial [Blastocatellia bacterium]|nr:hypothetical protein [Blastocatellia bacterium]
AYRCNSHGRGASSKRQSSCLRRTKVRQPAPSIFVARIRRPSPGAREVIMLDLFYVGVVVVFFVLLWEFTKAADRL